MISKHSVQEAGDTSGTLLVHFWYTSGTLLVRFWYASGTIWSLLVHSWYTPGTLLVRSGHFWYTSRYDLVTLDSEHKQWGFYGSSTNWILLEGKHSSLLQWKPVSSPEICSNQAFNRGNNQEWMSEMLNVVIWNNPSPGAIILSYIFHCQK